MFWRAIGRLVHKMKWTRTKIAGWNRRTFVGIKSESQLRKVCGECEEFFCARDYANKLEELADIYICAASLWQRFHNYLGLFIVRVIEKLKQWPEIQKAVDIKMEINVGRTFDENMHHIEEKQE